MITVDCYSHYFEIDQLYCTTTSTTANNLKNHFARHGISDEVMDQMDQILLVTKFQNLLNNGISYKQRLHHTTVTLMAKLMLL